DREALYAIGVLACCIALMSPTVWSVATVALEVGLASTILLFVYFNYYLPSHVLVPLYSAPVAAAILVGRGGFSLWPAGLARLWSLLGAGLRVAVIGASLFILEYRRNANQYLVEPNRHMSAAMSQLQPRADQLYVVWADDLKFHRIITPLSDPHGLKSFKCV